MAVLSVWGGDWDLPSVDPVCLEIMTVINIGEFPIKIRPAVAYSPIVAQDDCNLPSVSANEELYNGREQILEYLEYQNFTIDDWLTKLQFTDCTTMKSFIQRNLQPYIEYMIWLNPTNYTSFTRKTYSKLCRFPSNYYIPNNMYKTIKNKLESLHNTEDHEEIGNIMFSDATECLNLFSSFLDDKPYLFGDRPSSLDAMLFSYLSIISKAPVQSDRLRNHMVACENLDSYTGRIKRNFHKKAEIKIADEKAKTKEHDLDENKEWILPSIVAITAMVSYAIHLGLLHFRHTK